MLRRMEKHSPLSEALRFGRLDDFIRQQKAAGVGPVDEAAFDVAASKVIGSGTRSGRTSRSPSHDGSTEK